MAPADAMVLPLDGAPLAPAVEVEEPLPAEGAVPVAPPVMLPELMPVAAPVPLIEASHAAPAISATMLNAQPHAVLMRKVTFHIVRNLPLCATARLCDQYEMGTISWGDVR